MIKGSRIIPVEEIHSVLWIESLEWCFWGGLLIDLVFFSTSTAILVVVLQIETVTETSRPRRNEVTGRYRSIVTQ
jgi:hypothetical protein